MRAAIVAAQSDGIEGVAFSDLFPADVRQYREKMMARTGIMPLFPLWGDPQPNGGCTLCRNNTHSV
jgi:diphthamide synthase (EF-2-diphthine--ammonia ligase)